MLIKKRSFLQCAFAGTHYFYIIGNFFEITYDITTLREHAHAFAKEECRKNATQKRRTNVLCTFFVLVQSWLNWYSTGLEIRHPERVSGFESLALRLSNVIF